MALSYTQITGTFEGGDGTPLTGSVTFTPSEAVYASGVPVLQPDVPVQAQITAGQLQSLSGGPVRLLATDNPGLSYEGLTGFFYWSVQVTVSAEALGPWSFFLPSSPATADLYSLAHTAAGGGGVSSFAGRTGAVVPATGDYTAAQTGADPSGAAAARVARAGDTMTGPLVPAVAALTDAATVSVNAALGNDFRLALTTAVGASRAIGAPSNPADGQQIEILLTQPASGGPCTVTWNAVYDFGTAGAPVLTATASKTDVVAFKYRAPASAWYCLGSALGF